MTQHPYSRVLSRFRDLRVLVVGDLYLDEYTFGRMTGISLEAPIPIFEVQERRHNPGAAGNAACNIASMGARTWVVGYVGADVNADILRREFIARNVDPSGIVVHPRRPTNTYGKLKAGGHNIPMQEVLRTDTPRPAFVEPDIEAALIEAIRDRAPEVDVIVVGDQVSSVVTERVLEAIVDAARQHGILTVGDSRERAGAFGSFDAIVPNDREAGLGAGVDASDEAGVMRAGEILRGRCRNVFITRGGQGITVFREDGGVATYPTTVGADQAVDVTGAGDTVTAAVALTLAAGGSPDDAAVIGNAAAGVAVTKPGVVTVSQAELERALSQTAGPTKLKTLEELRVLIADLQREGHTVVWTNGCFDILHAGHIAYLQRAAAEGDVMVVGLNSDESVRRLKGPERPVVPEAERALILSALGCVDYVTIFGETDTTVLLDALKPDVYAKGGDYTIDTINQTERRLVESYGGRIALVPGVQGLSTTSVIARIRQ